jgi:glycosyltransferase involved in cell wall biosynthesis
MAESSDIYHDYRVQKEANSLLEDGWRVTVYGFRTTWKQPDPAPIKFTLVTLPLVSRHRRRLRNLSIMVNVALLNLWLLTCRAEVYHAHNTMFLLGMWLSSRLHRGWFVYDAHEVQWEHGRILAWLERRFIGRADARINVAAGRAQAVANRYGLQERDITIVANYPVVDQATPTRRYQPHEGPLRLVYSGGYDIQSNRLDLLLRAMQIVPGCELNLIAFGYRDSEAQLRHLAETLGIEDRIIFHPLVRPDEVMDAVAKYDVAVNMLTNPMNHLSIRHSSVNKMYEYMAAGMPTLCSDLDSFVEEFVKPGAAVAVDATNVTDIARGLQELMNNRARLVDMCSQASGLARTRFNWASQEERLQILYRNLMAAES